MPTIWTSARIFLKLAGAEFRSQALLTHLSGKLLLVLKHWGPSLSLWFPSLTKRNLDLSNIWLEQRVISGSSIVIHAFHYALVTAASSASAGPHVIDAKKNASGCPLHWHYINSGEMWDEIQIAQINTSIRSHLQINARHWSAAETAQAKQDILFRGWNSALQSVPWTLGSILSNLSNTFWETRPGSLKVICCENYTTYADTTLYARSPWRAADPSMQDKYGQFGLTQPNKGGVWNCFGNFFCLFWFGLGSRLLSGETSGEMQVSCESEYCCKEKLVEYIIMHTYLYQVINIRKWADNNPEKLEHKEEKKAHNQVHNRREVDCQVCVTMRV